jgi:hypothetical protein
MGFDKKLVQNKDSSRYESRWPLVVVGLFSKDGRLDGTMMIVSVMSKTKARDTQLHV